MADSIIREIYDEHFGAKIQLKRRASGRGTYLAVSTDSPDYSIPQLLSCFQRPLSYHVRVTKKCNLSCPYCYAEDQTNTEDMSDAQVWELISRANREGAMLFSWTGGEPLLRTGIIGNVKKCAVGKHPKSEKHGNTAQFSEVERSGTQENCGGIGSGCRLRLHPLPVLRRRQSHRVACIDPDAVVVDKNIAKNDRFDLFSR